MSISFSTIESTTFFFFYGACRKIKFQLLVNSIFEKLGFNVVVRVLKLAVNALQLAACPVPDAAGI
jgi:hypothetical protein